MTSTALLIMDVQQGLVDRFGSEPGYLDGLQHGLDGQPD